MDIKHSLNEIYNSIVKPLIHCTEDLNSVAGMLNYIKLSEKAKAAFDQQMKKRKAN